MKDETGLRILFLLTQSLESPGGVGRFWPLAKALTQLGHEVTLVALHHDYASLSERRFRRDGVDVWYVAQMHVRKVGNAKLYFSPWQLLWVTFWATVRLTWAALRTPCEVVHVCKTQPMNGVAAWVLHPTGGGPALMWALFVVGVLSVFGGAFATGALSATWRGPPWIAVGFPLLYGSIVSLRISVPDPMALALAMGALVVYVRHVEATTTRWWRDPWSLLALLLAAAAVLTRETRWFVFLGFGLANRTRRVLPLVVVPALAAATWAFALLWLVPPGQNTNAFAMPFTDLWRALGLWSSLNQPMAYLNVLGAALVVAYALAKRVLRHPLAYVVGVQLAHTSGIPSSRARPPGVRAR